MRSDLGGLPLGQWGGFLSKMKVEDASKVSTSPHLFYLLFDHKSS